ncbi:MAG TPA: hypothetical protein DDY13_03675 [Cytophagales bacterium]|jgi:neutral ceramidase|nr:hypothetical protein [Cytophagales bacterium]
MKRIIKILVIFFVGLLFLVLLLIKPVTNRNITQTQAYQKTIKAAEEAEIKHPAGPYRINWFKVNITPELPVEMAGYFPKTAGKIHDPLYVRVIAIYNDQTVVPIISADLLMFPPELKHRIIKGLDTLYQTALPYFGAIHTHNGMGHWTPSIVGEKLYGDFNKSMIFEMAKQIVEGVYNYQKTSQPFQVSYISSVPGDFVQNRVDKEAGMVDPVLRNIAFKKSNNELALLTSYSAHPTLIDIKEESISADYPGFLVRKLEQNENINFSMFMAGMVGSHRLYNIPGSSYELAENAARILSSDIEIGLSNAKFDSVTSVAYSKVALSFMPSALRIDKNIGLRNWIFNWALEPLEGDLVSLKINRILLMGTPCDFSGEIFVRQKIDTVADFYNIEPFITSFNGNYVGYINSDYHYFKSDAEEVRALNWTGPGFSQYFSDVIKTNLKTMSGTNRK